MHRWIRNTLLGVFGASIALGGLTACGHSREHARWNASAEDQAKFRERMVDRVARHLDLNADQKAKLAVLAGKLQEQRAALVGGTDPRTQVRGLVAGDRFDRTKAQALLTEKTGAVQARSPEVIAALADFYDSLNPQQQAQVRERLDKRRGWWHRS
ncbi:MAG TPA: Spy/CpxP family protein refolding chaperone [Ramlibacter sp.]|nr:Spy/CpxP family protein refolding chaperone [Ramlibacter sp.]